MSTIFVAIVNLHAIDAAIVYLSAIVCIRATDVIVYISVTAVLIVLCVII